jgi:D-beta-D-heptose 7-phosphate kinase/D-beta-D-heptose 1-phosphate adenosyltransferase
MGIKKLKVAASNTRSVEVVEPSDRFIRSEKLLDELVSFLRKGGQHVVLTQGTFDLVHIGHARYVRKAKSYGSVLIVGVDDDKKARGRKGSNRPFIPLTERMEMLAHLRGVDFVVVKKHSHPKWHLIKLICPDTLIAVEGTYTEDEINELRDICGRVVVLPRQAATSTSAKIRKATLAGTEALLGALTRGLPNFLAEAQKVAVEEA